MTRVLHAYLHLDGSDRGPADHVVNLPNHAALFFPAKHDRHGSSDDFSPLTFLLIRCR